ncbi:MAG: hypothetical protein GX648_03050 [Crenarchaeota archaeon]|nr:hypothetical protein [Thermoproteota archaeon]
MGLPDSAIDTGKKFLGMNTYTDELIPNCGSCFIISGTHERTKEMGFYASCKKTGKLELVGPYKSYFEALKVLVATKGCDSCTFNKAELKAAYLPFLNEKIKEEIASTYGIGHPPSVIMSPLQLFVETRNYLNINFKAKFGIDLFKPLTDDLVAGFDLAKPCVDQRDFALKIQALAGLIDRIDESELKKRIKNKDGLKNGSINALERFLNENFPEYPKNIIFNLRHLLTLRSKIYPTHASTPEVIIALNGFRIGNYPLKDWDKGVSKILDLCSTSLYDLLTLIQQ